MRSSQGWIWADGNFWVLGLDPQHSSYGTRRSTGQIGLKVNLTAAFTPYIVSEKGNSTIKCKKELQLSKKEFSHMSFEVSEGKFSFDTLRESYVQIIHAIAATAQDFEKILREVNDETLVAKNGYTQKVFETFRERADSELLSIAFFSAFSSGKSFLVSGLNGKIEWFEHDKKDQYAPLLPSSPRHTSSCPVVTEPLPAEQKDDVFFVLFKEESAKWEQRPLNTPAIVQAYVTDLPNARAHRSPNKDRTRDVVAAKIGIASAKMRAKLYDLPGFGAIGVNYENVIRSFIQKADCIVYVAWAVRPLDEKELELLGDIYNHHKDTGKPVFFVLTQIDRAWAIDTASGKVDWEDVLEANNEFLYSNFLTPDGKPDSAFIGAGFIPVSPALEAKGISLAVQEPERAKQLVADGRMNDLRNRLNEYLHHTSGPMHLAELASEAQRLLIRLEQDIRQRERAESTPLEAAQKSVKGYKAQRSILIEGKSKLEADLISLGQAAIKRAFAGNDPDDLAALLSARLQEKIKASDVLNRRMAHQLEAEKASIVRGWLSRSTKALIPRWVNAWEAFFNQSYERVERLLGKALDAQNEAIRQEEEEEADITAANVEEHLASQYEDTKAKTLKETLDILSTTWKTWTVIAGIGATGVISSTATATAVPLLATLGGPVGWGIIATATIGAAFGKWKQAQQNMQRREAMIQGFPEYSRRVLNAYQTQADEFIRSRVGFLLELVDDEIASLSSSISSLEQRLSTGEYTDRNKRLAILKRLAQQCEEVDSQVNEFYRTSVSIQPSVSVILGDKN